MLSAGSGNLVPGVHNRHSLLDRGAGMGSPARVDEQALLRRQSGNSTQEIKDESIDFVYLDPPFNSQASYNLPFKAPD